MVGLSDPGHYGQLDLYETPQGTTGPANADAEISADPTVSKDISLLDQHGSQVLLGETLMVPIANSMVYLRPLYVAATTNPQPQLAYVVAVLGKNVQIDTSLLGRPGRPAPDDGDAADGSGGVPSSGTVPAAVAGYLQQAQTDYTNALAALKAGNLAAFQSDIQAMAPADHARPSRCSGPAHAGRDDDHHHDDGAEVKPGKTSTKTSSTTTHDVVDVDDDHDGADEHRAQEADPPRRRRRWPRPQPGAEAMGRPAARRARILAGPAEREGGCGRGRGSHDVGSDARTRGKEGFRWDCSTRSRRRRRRPRRWPRTRPPRARRR